MLGGEGGGGEALCINLDRDAHLRIFSTQKRNSTFRFKANVILVLQLK